MKNKDGNLERALKKVSPHYKNVYCGYLTPSEMLALIKRGAKESPNSIYSDEYINEKIAKGDSRPDEHIIPLNPK